MIYLLFYVANKKHILLGLKEHFKKDKGYGFFEKRTAFFKRIVLLANNNWTFDDRAEGQDFFFPKKKRVEEKENEVAKIVIKGHAFLLDHHKI